MSAYDTKTALLSAITGLIDTGGTAGTSGQDILDSMTHIVDSLCRFAVKTNLSNADLDGLYRYTYNHALNYKYVIVKVIDNNDQLLLDNDYLLTFDDVDNITITFAGALTGTYKIIVERPIL